MYTIASTMRCMKGNKIQNYFLCNDCIYNIVYTINNDEYLGEVMRIYRTEHGCVDIEGPLQSLIQVLKGEHYENENI